MLTELASSVAVVTGILSQVAAPREVVGAIPDARPHVLLRLPLDGDLKARTRATRLCTRRRCLALRWLTPACVNWLMAFCVTLHGCARPYFGTGRVLLEDVTITHSSPTPRESRVLL